jgi:hypothetical protein
MGVATSEGAGGGWKVRAGSAFNLPLPPEREGDRERARENTSEIDRTIRVVVVRLVSADL